MPDVTTIKYYAELWNMEGYAAVMSPAFPDPPMDYTGVASRYEPRLIIPFSEFDSLTEQAPTSDPYIIGDVNGFTSATWHTRSVILAHSTINPNIKIAIMMGLASPYTRPFAALAYYPGTGDQWEFRGFSGGGAGDTKEYFYNNILPDAIFLALNANTTYYSSVIRQAHNGTFSTESVPTLNYFFRQCEIVAEAPDPEPTPPAPDPYSGAGTSDHAGGDGTLTDTGDIIDIPALPTVTASSTNFITLLAPTLSQLRELSTYMWGSLFDLESWKKIFADPMDAILGLSIVPVHVPVGATGFVTVGNISTNVSMTRAASQFVEVDCGTLTIPEYWGAYLDYEPYTKFELYLPYIGTHAISADDIMGKSIQVIYHVDILTGACCAYVKCGGTVIYTFVGQCSISIPITGNDWTNVINGAVSIAASIGKMAATGGATAPTTVSNVASIVTNSLKPSIEKSGALGGAGGLLGIQKPYLIVTRPRQALPERQNTFIGYPAFITRKLGDLSGYTEIESVHLGGIPATDTEMNEIETLLKGGVIL